MSTGGIVAEGLTRSYGDLLAADNVSLSVQPGEVVGLLGPNGAGKTTTLRMLATLLTPSAGRATVAGYDIAAAPLEVRRRLGYLTGDTGLYNRLNAREILRFFGRLHGWGPRRIEERTEVVVDLLGITDFAQRRTERLSTGQRQRISIARAVFVEPPVLILDEPTSGLDILAARDILEFFRLVADAGTAVLISTHIMAEVELICDRAAIIHRGTVRCSGTLDELRALGGDASLSAGFFRLLGEEDRGSAKGPPH